MLVSKRKISVTLSFTIKNYANMKNRTLFLLFALMIIFPAGSYSQVGNLLKNKLNKVVSAGVKTADKEIDNQIDTAVNRGAENAREKAEVRVENNRQNADAGQPSQSGGANESSQGGVNLGRLMANKVDLKYKDNYHFTSRLHMLTETYDKKDVLKMDFYMYFSSSTPSVSVETKSIGTEEDGTVPLSTAMVMDGENKCFLMLSDMNGMKMGMISAIPEEGDEYNSGGKNEKNSAPPSFTKTGNTRTIAGYKCDEYTYTDVDDKTTGKVWFTKDANVIIDKNGWNNSGMSAYYGNPEFNNGIILANEVYDEKGNLTMKSETVEINKNFPHSVSLEGYSLRQINMKDNKKK